MLPEKKKKKKKKKSRFFFIRAFLVVVVVGVRDTGSSRRSASNCVSREN